MLKNIYFAYCIFRVHNYIFRKLLETLRKMIKKKDYVLVFHKTYNKICKK